MSDHENSYPQFASTRREAVLRDVLGGLILVLVIYVATNIAAVRESLALYDYRIGQMENRIERMRDRVDALETTEQTTWEFYRDFSEANHKSLRQPTPQSAPATNCFSLPKNGAKLTNAFAIGLSDTWKQRNRRLLLDVSSQSPLRYFGADLSCYPLLSTHSRLSIQTGFSNYSSTLSRSLSAGSWAFTS